METWANCFASMPSSAVTAAVTAVTPVTGSSGSRSSSALAGTLTIPAPRLAARCWSGRRRTVYTRPRWENSSSTRVSVSGAAKSLRSMVVLRFTPVVSPYSA